MRARMLIALVLGLLPGCLYDGEGTAGLPCIVDNDCAALACIDDVCGGAPGSSGLDTDGDTEDDESGGMDQADEPTPQNPPEPCIPETQSCVGSSALSYCTEDAKLTTTRCEGICGPEDPVVGGCQPSPLDGVDYCWCESVGTPSDTCGDGCSGDWDCDGGESCLSLTTGSSCAPSACQGCFDNGQQCGWLTASCKFTGCG